MRTVDPLESVRLHGEVTRCDPAQAAAAARALGRRLWGRPCSPIPPNSRIPL